MPPLPTFDPVPAPALAPVPFTDTKSLISYVMRAYTQMGPEKGSRIQGILTSLGYQNINDVQPSSYADLYREVEALK
jgi:hypothetical protein